MIRVVIADDEQKICQLIAKLVNWEKLEMELVGTAGDGYSTLELIEEKKPDLVLTDIRMPGYDGLELIEKARELQPELEFVIISGYSHFSYAQAAIRYGVSDYLLKPVNRELLHSTMLKVRDKILLKKVRQEGMEKAEKQISEDTAALRAGLLNELWNMTSLSGQEETASVNELWNMTSLSGQEETASVSEAKRLEINERYRYEFQEGCYRCHIFGVAIRDLSRLTSEYAKQLFDMIFPGMHSLFNQYMKPCCYESELFHHDGLMTGIINYAPGQEEKIRQVTGFLLARLKEEARVISDMQVYLAEGEAGNSLIELSRTLPGVREMLTQRFLTPSIQRITACTPDVVYDQDALFKPLSDGFNRTMETGDEKVLIASVKQFRDAALRMQLSGSQLLRAVRGAYHVYVLTGVFHKGYHPGDRERLEADFARRADLCADTAMLFAFLEKTCLEHFRKAVRELSTERMRPLQQAMAFMQEHYMEDIGLEDVSAAAGFSGSYFSTVFKKETGRSFLEYLTDLRMEEARRLLRENKMNIEMVGRAVGLANYKRFARTFKKETGVSPGEYRSLYAR